MNKQQKKKGFLSRKKGIFFLFDSLFAIVVLITGTVLVFSTYTATPNTFLTHSYAVQMLDQLHDVQVQDLTTPYLLDLRFDGKVPDEMLDKSLLQLIFYYIERGDTENVVPLFNESIGVVFPTQYNMEFSINNTGLYNLTRNQVAEEDARFLIVERRIFLSEYNGTLYGPNITKVKIW